MKRALNQQQPLLPLYVAVIFGLIAPLFMGYAAYEIGRQSLYHQTLVDKLSADGVATTATITERGPCKGSGRQPLDCWISYEFQAGHVAVRRPEVRVRWTESRGYAVGQTIKVMYSAQSPEHATHRTLSAHEDHARSNFWAAVFCIVFIIAVLYIATRQLIGHFLTHTLAVATAVLYSCWFAGLLAAQ